MTHFTWLLLASVSFICAVAHAAVPPTAAENQYLVPNYITQGGAENGRSGWVTYDDAASTPVDGTGGTVSETWTVSNSSPLAGTYSFILTKDAADRTGEGVAFAFSLDSAQKNRDIAITFDYEGSANFVAGEASDVRVWVYDVTNSTLIQPTRNTIQSGTGRYVAQFRASSSVSYRLLVHTATTNASAWTFKVDNVKVSPVETVFGFAGSDYQRNDSLITFAAPWGTVANKTIEWARVGDSMRIKARWQCGTATGSTTSVSLPGYTLDSSKLGGAAKMLGSCFQMPNGGTAIDGAGRYPFFDGSDTTNIYFAVNATNSPDKGVGTAVCGSSFYMECDFEVPISGWNSNVTLANGSTFRMSSVLANGTRVTSTPDVLGEYRTYVKTITATSGTDNAPSAAPSATDGMRIYAVPYGSAGTSGQTNRWEVFIGKNKHFRVEAYSAAAKTGWVSIDRKNVTTLIEDGLDLNYDPTTGVLIIDAMEQASTTTTRNVGRSFAGAGAAASAVTDAYFDVIVSENALAIGGEQARCHMKYEGGVGNGSTNTRISRIETLTRSDCPGGEVEYSTSSTDGSAFTVRKDGVYAFGAGAYSTGSFHTVGISIGSTQLTTSIQSINFTDVGCLAQIASGYRSNCSGQRYIAAGTVVRTHNDGTINNPCAGNLCYFWITKVGN